MEININTNLENYILVENLTDISNDVVSMKVKLENAKFFILSEAMAQLCSIHLRRLNNFKEHSFLLKVNKISPWILKELNGSFTISAKLVSKSSKTFYYAVNSISENNNQEVYGEFYLSLKEYDQDFKKNVLEKHYREVLKCSQN